MSQRFTSVCLFSPCWFRCSTSLWNCVWALQLITPLRLRYSPRIFSVWLSFIPILREDNCIRRQMIIPSEFGTSIQRGRMPPWKDILALSPICSLQMMEISCSGKRRDYLRHLTVASCTRLPCWRSDFAESSEGCRATCTRTAPAWFTLCGKIPGVLYRVKVFHFFPFFWYLFHVLLTSWAPSELPEGESEVVFGKSAQWVQKSFERGTQPVYISHSNVFDAPELFPALLRNWTSARVCDNFGR